VDSISYMEAKNSRSGLVGLELTSASTIWKKSSTARLFER
jgi:hypothetical protein